LTGHVASSKPLAGGTAFVCSNRFVLDPGEPEAGNEKRNREQGLDLSEDTLADLPNVAERTGVVPEFPF
jgi:hypothetical protein